MADDYSYGCVIDAGSSGSRVHVYQWSSKDPSSPIQKYSSYRASPGISDPDEGIPLLLDLLASAQNSLPVSLDIDMVPVFLGATAGMRILDPSIEASIMNEIRSLLHTSGFQFRDEWARTISGEEEGAYGWLVVNYLKNGAILPKSDDMTYGAIDLGGASVQMSFRPSGAILSNMFPVRVEKNEYLVYTHSYLYYGVDQAKINFDENYLNNSSMINPCYPVGYTDDSGISGSGEWLNCLAQVAALFDLTDNCYQGDGSSERCSFNGVYQPPHEDKRFIAMSSFVYTWEFLGLNMGAGTDDLAKMMNKAQKVCSLAYDDQIEYYDNITVGMLSERSVSYIHLQCFNAAYTYQLLHSGFGLPITNTPIEIYNDINGTRVDWALGMMLVERNKGSCGTSELGSTISESNSSGVDTIDYELLFVSTTVSFVLILCLLGFLLLRVRRKYKLQVEGTTSSHT